MLKKKYTLLNNILQGSTYDKSLFTRLILICFVILSSGCAGKIPVTRPLVGAQQVQAGMLLEKLQHRGKTDSLDADIAVSWSGYGGKQSFSGTLQAVRTGQYRLSILDPLGRPVFLLTVNKNFFTFVDNRQARGYTGPVDSSFLHQYIPAAVSPAVLYSLLTAQVPDISLVNVTGGQGNNRSHYWFAFPCGSVLHRLVEVDEVSGQLVRQVIRDKKTTLLEVIYKGFQGETGQLSLPVRLLINSKNLPGSVELVMKKVFPNKIFPDSLFTIAVPKYYQMSRVE